MTAPGLPATGRLAAVAAWDVPLLRRATRSMTVVAERLPSWRARLEGIWRALDSGQRWSGPAARGAAAAVRELSVVAWAVDAALVDSLAALERLTVEAGAAQDLAGAALGSAAAPPGGLDAALDERGRLAGAVQALVPDADSLPAAAAVLAAAEAALAHAAAAAAAAEDAGAALTPVGVRDAFVPAAFSDLTHRIPLADPVCVPRVPLGRPPTEVAAWWAGLPLPAQLAAIRSAPASVGALDGVPAWARDRANRLLLTEAVRDPGTTPYAAFTARVVARRIGLEEAGGRQVQLHLLDLAGDRVVLGLGDLDRADAVALLVPGIWNSAGDDLSGLVRSARGVATAATAAAPGRSVATAVWLGYRTPASVGEIGTRVVARRAGPALATALAGLDAARQAVAEPAARTTVLAHSYGTVVVDEAADEPGALAADAVVLLGSPGMEGNARSLEAPEVYDAAAPGDPVAGLGWFGTGTWAERYGSTALPVQGSTGHSGYYDPDGPTLRAMGEVVAGRRPAE